MIGIIVNIIVSICLLALFTAILINFIEVKKEVSKTRKSVVETGSMTAFFVLIYLLIRFSIGKLEIHDMAYYIVIPAGLAMLVLGCYINIKGRMALGANWANQVTLYKDQTLVMTGVYRYLRHPLYGSLIWMFYGASLVYTNYLVFLATTFIFCPFMYYRARQEEKFLMERFSDYKDYKKKTRMLFPRIF